MTFSLVLHEASQPGWWLMRWTAGDRSDWREEGASRSIYCCSFQNRHYKNAANDCNCHFPAVGCIIFCIYAVTWTFISGFMSWADPANAITWKNLSLVSRDPGTALPGSLLTGLLAPSCTESRSWFLLRLTNVPRSRQTDTSPSNRASSAHLIRPFDF